MAEFTYPELQTLPYRQAALLNNTSCGCNKGYINHQNGFGGILMIEVQKGVFHACAPPSVLRLAPAM